LPKRTETKSSAFPQRERADDEFAGAFGRAHDAGGADGFVGGDEDEPANAVLYAGARDGERAADIVAHGFGGLRLHQVHVLVRRGMEDDLRAGLGKHALDESASPMSPTKGAGERRSVPFGAERLDQLEQVVFRDIDEE
jgi:hypothetical protein